MNKLSMILIAAALAVPGASQPPRKTGAVTVAVPPPPGIKGLKKPMGLTDQALMQATLRDLPGSVVVVEDEAFHLVPSQEVRIGAIRILEPAYGSISGMPLAPWMDGPATVSGGNTIAQVYCLGWGYR